MQAQLTAELVAGVPTTYTLTTVTQRVLIFNAEGYLIETRDPQGRRTILDRGIPDGLTSTQVLTVTDQVTDRALYFDYTLVATKPRLSAVRDSASREVTYTYSTAGDLETVTNVQGQVTTYGYSNHRLSTITLPGQSQPQVTTLYDGQGRVASQTDTGCEYF